MQYDKSIFFHLELSEAQAQALAQFIKRVTFSGVRECAMDDAEAYDALAGLNAVRAALAEGGFDPR